MKKIFLTVLSLILVAILAVSIAACKDDFSENDLHGYSATEAVVRESDNKVSLENIENMIVINTDTWYFTSGIPNNGITAKYYGDGENVVFTFCTDNGSLRNKNGYGRTVDVKAEETLYWSPDEDTEQAQGTNIRIVLKINDHISGYALLKVTQKSSLEYSAEVVKTAVFPKINGAYQSVTQSQLEAFLNTDK